MRAFILGEDLFHCPTNLPAKFVRASGSIVTVEIYDPAGTGERVQCDYPADEFETYDERNSRLEHETEENRAVRNKPKPAPLYDV